MATKLYNLARMTTATTGTGTITLGSAVAPYLTFAQAGIADGDIVSYGIRDGTSNSEIGYGTYTASGTTLTRNVTNSSNSNNAISLSGNAEVFITPRAQDIADTSTDYVNKFRNPDFSVWQRGTALTGVSSQYTADGWTVTATGANVAVARATNARAGALTPYVLQVTGATSVTDVTVKQRIEGFIVAPMASQYVTFQLWVRNNTGASFTPTITVKHANAADNWSATTTDVNAVSLQACPDNTHTQISYTFLANASSGNGLEVTIDFGNNFSAGTKSIQIGEADFRIASVLQWPSFRNYPAELLYNQRYYWRLNNDNGGTAQYIGMAQCYSTTAAFGCVIWLPTPLRIPPTGTLNSGPGSVGISNTGHLTGSVAGGGNGGAFTGVVATKSQTQFILLNNLTGGSGYVAGDATFIFFNNASAWIDVSVEL